VAKEAYERQVKSLRFDYSDDKLQSIIDRGLEEAKSTSKLGVADVYDTASFARYRELARAASLL